MIDRTGELADRLAATEAAGDPRVPHEVTLAIIGGEHPVRAFRNHQELTLRELSGRSGVALSYLSETEHGRKPGSVAAGPGLPRRLDPPSTPSRSMSGGTRPTGSHRLLSPMAARSRASRCRSLESRRGTGV